MSTRISKYRNRKTEVDGIVFDSKKEAVRYRELKILQKQGVIQNLVIQPKYPITVRYTSICEYIADFEYYENTKITVEDVKGMKTPVYKLKKKLFEAIYGIKITEI
jgi:hypothetical protein